MYFHKEGIPSAIVMAIFWIVVFASVRTFLTHYLWLQAALLLAASLVVVMVIYFFRITDRDSKADVHQIISVADGKVVAIEPVIDHEYFNGREVLQISVFMSPLNMHANWAPVTGVVTYFAHHNGKFRTAWHPKSSSENERTGIGIKAKNGKELLVKQIAGAMARRVVTYVDKGDKTEQGKEIGFIKFGSRIDLLLPADVEVLVKIGDKVKGAETVLACW